jgi:hypothetical protein
VSRRTMALVCGGRVDAPVQLIEPIARVLELEEEPTQWLYRVAAIDRGYRARPNRVSLEGRLGASTLR